MLVSKQYWAVTSIYVDENGTELSLPKSEASAILYDDGRYEEFKQQSLTQTSSAINDDEAKANETPNMARNVDITLIDGNISPLRIQRSLLFQVTWEDTQIKGVTPEEYFASLKNAKQAEKEKLQWQLGKEFVNSGFYYDGGGVKYGLWALENAGITCYIPSKDENKYLQISTKQKLSGKLKEEEVLIDAEQTNVRYKILINVDEFVDLGSSFMYAFNGGTVSLSYKVIDLTTGETIATLKQSDTKGSISAALQVRMVYTMQNAVRYFAAFLVD